MQVLLVCSGNMCRSPFAEAALRAALHEAGVEATVRSAGFLTEGRAPPGALVEVARHYDLEIADHRSRLVEVADLDQADLVLAMTREQLRQLAILRPALWPRTFTLKEVVRRGVGEGPRRSDQSVEAWIAAVHEGRQTTDLLGSSLEDDVEDPMGGTVGDYELTAAELSGLVGRLVTLLWPAVIRGGLSGGGAP